MAVPSIWNPPVWPDFHTCNIYYGSIPKPNLLDCQVAQLLLPHGSENETWYIGGGMNGIPKFATYGTCQIRLQASGPAAHHGQTFSFAPDMIVNMAGWVIDQCVGGAHMGGYATAEFSNTVEYVSRPDTFYDDPFSSDTTFLNVVVWNSDRLFPAYNPGNTDPTTGTVLLANIAAAYEKEPDSSPLKPNIERNFEYFQQAALAMRLGSSRTWWEGSQESLTNSSAANVTEYLNNLTLPSNVTLPKNLTLSASKSTSVCAGAGQGIAAGCGGQDDALVATS